MNISSEKYTTQPVKFKIQHVRYPLHDQFITVIHARIMGHPEKGSVPI